MCLAADNQNEAALDGAGGKGDVHNLPCERMTAQHAAGNY